jgi:hypothetical protein
MKKELLIVILIVIGIIGISILLKYVIFKNYSSTGNICTGLCAKEKLSTSRCGYNDCSSDEKITTPTGDNIEKVKEFCSSKFETKPTIPGAWVCCCK